MRKFSTLILILICQLGFGQNFQSEFQKYLQENDTINQLRVLTEWEKSEPKNAELFTSYFNYYVKKSRKEAISISTEQPNGESFLLKDSLNNIAGYFGNQVHYDQQEIQKGFEKIDEGIKLYPNRLDMRFGKIYVLGLLENWETFTTEIIKSIKYSSENKNAWTWTNNEKKENGKDFFLTSIQDYQIQLYNTENDDLLVNMREIANEILKYYPNHIESLSNLSITYLLTGEYDKGIDALKKAEKINPKDFIILSNIAQGYKLKGDKEKAIEYYQKTIEYGDEQAKEYSKQQIKELKK